MCVWMRDPIDITGKPLCDPKEMYMEEGKEFQTEECFQKETRITLRYTAHILSENLIAS